MLLTCYSTQCLVIIFQIKSLSAIFNGPETFVVASKEAFHPVPGAPRDPQLVKPRKRPAYDGDMVASRLKEKREKLTKTSK